MCSLMVRWDPLFDRLQYGQPNEAVAGDLLWFELKLQGSLGAMIRRDGFTPDGMHYACFLGHLALALEVATADEILGDYGLVHEYAHGLAFDHPLCDVTATVGGSPCSHTVSQLADLADDIQAKVSSAISQYEETDRGV